MRTVKMGLKRWKNFVEFVRTEKTNPINFTVDDFAGKIRCTNCQTKVVFSVQQEAVITIDYFGYT